MMTNATSSILNSWYTSSTSDSTGLLKGVDDENITTTSAGDTESAATLGKDDFLNVLLAQLKYQDPLDPADNTEFVAQLAQFSNLEQLTQINENIEETLGVTSSASESINKAMMVSYFGKTIVAETNEFVFDGKNEVQLSLTLDDATTSGTIKILNSSGYLVRSVEIGQLEAGNHTISWDGMNNRGLVVSSGTYTYEVEAENSVGEDVEWAPMHSGEVEGISIADGEAQLYVGGVFVSLSQIRHVTETEE